MEWKFGLSLSLLSLDMKACNKSVSSICNLDLYAGIQYFYVSPYARRAAMQENTALVIRARKLWSKQQ